MCDKFRLFLGCCILLFIGISFQTNAQMSNKDNSPYNRFGIGTLTDSRNAAIRGMGGTASGYSEEYTVNSFNPASYAFLRFTTLEFALEARSRSILFDTVVKSSTATFSYFNLGIPLKKYAGMNIGFMPISNSYYKQSDSATFPSVGGVSRVYEGTGALQYAFLGFAGQYKGFAAGVNVGYLFGSNNKNSAMYIPVDSFSTRNSSFITSSSIGGIYWKAGLMYHTAIQKDKYFTVGATANIAQNMNVKRDQCTIASTYAINSSGSSVDSAIDTLYAVNDLKGKMTMPADYSIGAHFGKTNYWDVGADFNFSDWKKYNMFSVDDSVADNTWRVAVGGEITPNPLSRNSYLSRMSYRLGFYYGNDYVYLRNTPMNYWGATVGFAFPFVKERLSTQYAKLNTAIEVGNRGTTQNGLAREFFVKLSVGISFNDIWFKKRVFE